jgi:hypothetical protein
MALSDVPNLTLPLTLLSRIQKFKSHKALSTRVPHPFTSNAEASSALQELIQATQELLPSFIEHLTWLHRYLMQSSSQSSINSRLQFRKVFTSSAPIYNLDA